jgi:cyanobactin biosynthesis protein (PatB/AcyB/McaB family)
MGADVTPERTTGSTLPRQDPPIKRPDLVQPREAVDVLNGDPEEAIRRAVLLYRENYNDPAWFNNAAVAARGPPCCQECSLEAAGILPRR